MSHIIHQTFEPSAELAALVKCYWTLEVPASPRPERQRILPDGCIEIVFILGDDVKRYVSEHDHVIQPRAFVLGQITRPYFVEPTGRVRSFAVRFYPYGFAHFSPVPVKQLADKETALAKIFGVEQSQTLVDAIVRAVDTQERIRIIERFLYERLEGEVSVNTTVRDTIDVMLAVQGSMSVKAALANDQAKRRQLERNFLKQIGMSPKQLGKVIRLQAAVRLMLSGESESLSSIAHDCGYYDQAHFIKDFKEFTGATPAEFFEDGELRLSLRI